MSIKLVLKKNIFIRNAYWFVFNKWTYVSRKICMNIFGYRFLDDFFKLCNEYNIISFVTFGTLLGFIRDKCFIKSDTDIDLATVNGLPSDWITIEKIFKKLGFKKMYEQSLNGIILSQRYKKLFLYVDMYLYEDYGNLARASISFHEIDRIYKNNDDYSIMYRFGPKITSLEKVIIKKSLVMVPNNPKEHLEMVYGKNWDTPDPKYKFENENNLAKGVYSKVKFSSKE